MHVSELTIHQLSPLKKRQKEAQGHGRTSVEHNSEPAGDAKERCVAEHWSENVKLFDACDKRCRVRAGSICRRANQSVRQHQRLVDSLPSSVGRELQVRLAVPDYCQ